MTRRELFQCVCIGDTIWCRNEQATDEFAVFHSIIVTGKGKDAKYATYKNPEGIYYVGKSADNPEDNRQYLCAEYDFENIEKKAA